MIFVGAKKDACYFRNENSFTKGYDGDGVAGDEAAVKKFKEMEDAHNKQKRKK